MNTDTLHAALGTTEPVDPRAALLALGFLVDVADLSRDGGDLLEVVVSAAIIQANQAALRSDPAVRDAYADYGEALPDELRRPISVSAVAQSLRLSVETVRRKVIRLIERGHCVATPHGVYVPRAVIVGATHAAIQSARLARLNRLHDDLVRAGVLAAAEALPGPLPEGLKRTANRALSEYMLRSCDRMAGLAGGVQDGFVMLGLCEGVTDRLISDSPEPLRPCSGRRLAKRLGLPEETVRRRLGDLESRGFARHEADGWMPAAPESAHATIERLLMEQETDLRRLFARLKDLVSSGQNDPAPPL